MMAPDCKQVGIPLCSPELALFTLEEAGNQGNLGIPRTPNLPSRHRSHYAHEPIRFEANGLPLEYIGTISGAGEGPHRVRYGSVHRLDSSLGHTSPCAGDEPIRIQQGRNICTDSTYPRSHTSPQLQSLSLRAMPKLVACRLFPVIPFSKHSRCSLNSPNLELSWGCHLVKPHFISGDVEMRYWAVFELRST